MARPDPRVLRSRKGKAAAIPRIAKKFVASSLVAAPLIHASPLSKVVNTSPGRGLKHLLGTKGAQETPTQLDTTKISPTIDMAQGGYGRYDAVSCFNQTNYGPDTEAGAPTDDLIVRVVSSMNPLGPAVDFPLAIPNYRKELAGEQVTPPRYLEPGEFHDYETRIRSLYISVALSANVTNLINSFGAQSWEQLLRFNLFLQQRTTGIVTYIVKQSTPEGWHPILSNNIAWTAEEWTWTKHHASLQNIRCEKDYTDGGENHPISDFTYDAMAGSGVIVPRTTTGLFELISYPNQIVTHDWDGYVPPGYDLVVQIRFSEWAAGLRAAIAALDPYSVVVQVGANGIQVGRNARLPQ